MDSDASLVSSRPSSPEPEELFATARSKSGGGFSGGGAVSSSTPSDSPAGAGGGGAALAEKLARRSPPTACKKDKKQLTEPELQQLRLKINSRERKRMHDLNIAMDGLREVMPYAHGPSVRKLSKIATLLLARNYILMLTSSLEEMKRLLGELYGGHHGPAAGLHPALPVAHAAPLPGHAALHHPVLPPAAGAPLPASVRPAHGLLKSPAAAAPPLGSGFQHWGGMPCPCSMCQVPAAPATHHHVPGMGAAGLSRLTGDTK